MKSFRIVCKAKDLMKRLEEVAKEMEEGDGDSLESN